MAVTESNQLDPDVRQRVERVIKEFLSQDWYDGLFETRIQKLIFYTEVYSVVHYRKRVTEATYKPFMYGAYSEDVRDVLKEMEEVDRTRKIRHGKRTVEYSLVNWDREDDDAISRIVRKIHNSTKNTSSALARFSKDSWLFENTEYNHPMQFDEFVEALDENPEIEESVLEQVPDGISLSSGDLSDLVEVQP
jgi:uncharacterized protein YwgA